MSRKTVNIDEHIHDRAKALAGQTKMKISAIVELLIEGATEEDIIKLLKESVKKNK